MDASLGSWELVFTDPVTTGFSCTNDCAPSADPSRSGGYDCFQVTPSKNRNHGAVWAVEPFFLGGSFLMSSQLYFGDTSHGADGISLVLQTNGPDSEAGSGRIGVSGIVPSASVEFDTFYNDSNAPDVEADHVAVVSHGRLVRNELLAGSIAFANAQDIEDG